MPTVNNTVSCTSKFVKRVDLMSGVLNPPTHAYTHTKPEEHKNTRKVWEVLDMSITLIVVMVSWVFVYVQTHQIVHIK